MIITFTGDICVSGAFTRNIESNQEIFTDKILAALNKSNYVIGNLEGPTTNINPDNSIGIKLKSPISTIEYLAKRNLKVFNLANNHILDCNDEGLNDTFNELKKNYSYYFGAGNTSQVRNKTLILESGDCKIALFGLTDSSVELKEKERKVCTTKDLKTLTKTIQSLKENVDYIIINYHGGEEFTNYPSPHKRRYLKKISEIQGVDIVIAHHSHTLQGYEKHRGKYIFYSLGNFIFDISAHAPYLYTNESALLQFKFLKNSFTFDFVPYKINNGKINDMDSSIFSNYLKSISNFTNYIDKWRSEAYRVLFRKNLITDKIPVKSENKKPLQEKSLFGLLFSKKFYSKSVLVLLSNNYRSIYISAFIHKMKKRLM